MEIIELLEKKLQPEFMNSVFSWKEIKDALEEIQSPKQQYDCLHNQFCDKQSKDGKMFCEHDKGCNFKVES